ncbi:unnamed protein product [Gongylonema pulchrum]|uniref:Protein kinase domain-containing protein n=1 Tax=Gongylonema pulchrum TaxID=637853 RepID=A0A183D287_9BILA|nr:unnamed protein product [Gongylonema pulchrum]
MERSVVARRVHGPGKGRNVEITFGEERLHASGVFSNVYSAKLYRPAEMEIAIKKTWPVKNEKSTVNPEIYYLSRMKHPSINNLLYYFTLTSNSEVCHCMVFDYLPSDMAKLRKDKMGRRLPLLDAKLYAFQMFCAIDYVNAMGIAHRDVKPSNMIVNDEAGILKLADFGNAKLLRSTEENTPYQVTRYYRAPELIFGSTRYTTAVDIWACGCVLSEFVTGKVLLQGRDREDQARLVIDIFGYPTTEQCQAMKVKKPRYARKRARGLRVALEGCKAPADLLNLLSAILVYEPNMRLKGAGVIGHSFFNELRQVPAPVRENGRVIPPLDYTVYQQSTQKTEPDTSDDSEDEDD